MDESVHTVNAAAVVLAAAARSSIGLHRRSHRHHLQQLHDDHATATRKIRWWSRLKAKLCFRPPHVHPRRIADDASSSSPQPAAAYSVHHAPQPVFTFVAPPSSPATSLLQSDHSEAPSPPALLGHVGSPSPRSIFTVGPYAHGPQLLVSPPVLYSAFTTEPSSASLTPPAPDLHLALAATTNPSSPEVPFARFVASSSSMAEAEHCGGMLQAAYQLQPGSPIPVVSPSSSPQPFFRKMHRRNEGSLLDGHIPMLSTGAGAATDHDDEGRGDGGRDVDELPKSGEFVFGNADDGGAEDVAGNNWPAFLPHG